MHILIIEDEKRNFNRLKRLLEEIDGTFRIDGPLASIVEAGEWLQAHPAPELIFADIRLSDGLSFDVLRRTAVPSPVIFTTAYDEYAIQAFKYNSFDYLLKPVKADELAAAMEKVRRASSPQTNGEEVRQLLEYMRQSNYRYRERFLLPYRDGYISVQVKDISHIALDERNTLLCLNNGTSETVPYSLDELESQLNPDVFFRANRQYLIHMLSDCVTHNCIHFEREFLSRALIDGTVAGYLFNEYAIKIEDTADYFRSNMDMLDKDVRDEVFKRTRPILTRIKDEAPTYYGDEAEVDDCLIADGCRIEGHVENCVLFRDVEVEKGAVLKDCIIMEGGRILSEASLKHVVTDRNVVVRNGRTMMGDENYPITIAKNSTI